VDESLVREIEGLRSLLYSDRDPEGRAFVPLADAHRRGHDLERALQVIEDGLARHPSLASAHLVSAWIQRDRGDRESARAAWMRVLELDAENVEALRGLGTLLLDSGRVDEARPYLEKVRALDPDAEPPSDEASGIDEGPHVGGDLRIDEEPEIGGELEIDEEPEIGDEPQVVAAAAEAPLSGSEIPQVWAEPTALVDGGSRPDDEEAEDREPGELPATRTLAELFARQGLHARAAEIYERLVEERPDDPALRARLGELRIRERPPEAPAEPAGEATEALAREMSEAAAPETPDAPDVGGEPISSYFRRLLAWAPRRAVPDQATEVEAPAPVEAAGFESVVAVDDLAPDAVPIESLAPDWVPVESLAPDAAPRRDLPPQF
jgi:tetratricopeptide (TPR) repeat protein